MSDGLPQVLPPAEQPIHVWFKQLVRLKHINNLPQLKHLATHCLFPSEALGASIKNILPFPRNPACILVEKFFIGCDTFLFTFPGFSRK